MPRFIETIGWCAFYVAFLVFALTFQSASPIYRAIFIDRTAADWLPEASRNYNPPEIILGRQVSPYFAGGWWSLQADGRWGNAKRSTIIVRPTQDLPGGSRVKGRIGALLAGTRTNQTVIVEVNGIEVDRLDFSAKTIGGDVKDFDARLPASFASGEQVEIAFAVPDVTSFFLLHANGDFRKRGVRFFELALVPAR